MTLQPSVASVFTEPLINITNTNNSFVDCNFPANYTPATYPIVGSNAMTNKFELLRSKTNFTLGTDATSVTGTTKMWIKPNYARRKG